MAERSRDHPAFDYVMRNLETLNVDFAGQWIIAHSDGVFVSGPNLSELLTAIGPADMGRYAIAYMRPLPFTPPDDGGGNIELPLMPADNAGQLVRVG